MGMILAGLILMAVGDSGEKEHLTDAQIKERASALGMVELKTLDDLRSVNASAKNQEEISADGGNIPSPPETGEGVGESVSASDAAAGERVVITIQKGDTSTKVARKLEEVGLIEDIREFDTFLYEGGYARRLMVGTYEIEPGTGWEDIARILTRDRDNP